MKIKKIIIILSILTLSSCESKNEPLEGLKNETLTFDEFFSKVSEMNFDINDKNSIHIEYNWNKKDNTIKFISSSEKEPTWGIALDLAGKINLQKKSNGDEYEVSCSNGGKTTKSKCDGKWSCGKAIGKCLESRGCASICQLKMQYVSKYKSFYLSNELRQ